MSDAIVAEGAVLSIDGTPIGEVTSFQGPGGSASVIDVTHLQSAAKEKRIGLPDEGQFTFSGNFVPGDAGLTALRAARTARDAHVFTLVFDDDDTTTATFSAFVLTLSVSGGVDAKVELSVTLEITGATAWS